MPGSTHILDYVTFLRDLGKTNEPYFLEGGQAVNFWAEFYSASARADGLHEFLPFTSKDCDIWIGWAALKYFQAQKGGTFTKGDDPADGQIGVFTIDEIPPRTIDVMSAVYGIRPSKNDILLERAPCVNGITVLDPLNLFRSKCHCFSMNRCRRALREIKTHPDTLFPIPEMKESGLAQLSAYASATCPDGA